MKWLLLDDPLEHNGTMYENISAGLELYGQEVKVTFGLEETLNLMKETPFDYVIIHHYDFTKVDTLRGRFPGPKYCANSADILLFASPITIAGKLNKNLLEHMIFWYQMTMKI
ncbi:MAG: hypothetical protein PHD81_04355 [Candidatus Nanoarchaeia archaeon]|nr:hypothetical protein [Candidatus Nanoarchaeia archaeon]MDD5588310.1 hypothetical protein [Candidatus Nanoarchaeia archaeon]